MGDNDLDELISRARGVKMTSKERETQRRSFAYGNSKIENGHVTRDSINREAERLAAGDGTKHKPSKRQ